MTKSRSPSRTTSAMRSQGVRHQRLADKVRALSLRVDTLEAIVTGTNEEEPSQKANSKIRTDN